MSSQADAILDAAVNWLAAHPRITCALVCALAYAAFAFEGSFA